MPYVGSNPTPTTIFCLIKESKPTAWLATGSKGGALPRKVRGREPGPATCDEISRVAELWTNPTPTTTFLYGDKKRGFCPRFLLHHALRPDPIFSSSKSRPAVRPQIWL